MIEVDQRTEWRRFARGLSFGIIGHFTQHRRFTDNEMHPDHKNCCNVITRCETSGHCHKTNPDIIDATAHLRILTQE